MTLAALEQVDRSGSHIASRLRRLVAIPTVNPPGERYGEMVDCLEKSCAGLGMETRVHQVPAKTAEAAGIAPGYPRYNLIARWDVGAARTVHFNAHYDVVPAAGKWKFPPFQPQVENGWIYGRGSGDMKGSIVALLTAIDCLRRSGAQPAFNIECSFTADEETGGELGAGYIVRQGLVNAESAVVCEGASGTRVGLGHNGVLWLYVHLQGKPAHASNPDLGRNAFEAMLAVGGHLQRHKKELTTSARRYRDFNGKDRYPTLNIGGVFGGTGQKVNTVPGDAFFSIDRRVPPNERIGQAERELRSSIAVGAATQPQVRCRVETALRIDPCVMDAAHDLPQLFSRSVKAVRRRSAGFRVTSGFTDLHFFIEEAGIPAIGYGVDGRRAHGADERVRLRDVASTAKTYAHFMLTGV